MGNAGRSATYPNGLLNGFAWGPGYAKHVDHGAFARAPTSKHDDALAVMGCYDNGMSKNSRRSLRKL
jgi:hypothetical protein